MFKVGDIITGKPYSSREYIFTNEKAVMQVREVPFKFHIRVQILRHALFPRENGNEYGVNPEYFVHLTPPEPTGLAKFVKLQEELQGNEVPNV